MQRFHGLLLQFQAASNLLPERPRESKQVLTDAIDQVAEAITEGRDTVQGLRSSALDANTLADSLRVLAEELANERDCATTARVDVHGAPRELHPIVRDETFRIVAEALRNAFRHAAATRIDIEIRYEARRLCVRIRDDGRGIEPDVLRDGGKEGHFGLSGMRERAGRVGGTVTIRSAPESGTEVEFAVPASRAYGESTGAGSWLLHKTAATRDVAE